MRIFLDGVSIGRDEEKREGDRVDNLEAHGWLQYREWTADLVPGRPGGSAAEMEQSVVDPEELGLTGWEVLAGWGCGNGIYSLGCDTDKLCYCNPSSLFGYYKLEVPYPVMLDTATRYVSVKLWPININHT